MELYEGAWLDNISADADKSEPIVRLLDAVVIKLEGGNENDLRTLDEPFEEEKIKDELFVKTIRENKLLDVDERNPDALQSKEDNDKTLTPTKTENQHDESKESKSGDEDSSSSGGSSSSSDDDSDEEEKSKKDAKEKEKKKKKRKKSQDAEVVLPPVKEPSVAPDVKPEEAPKKDEGFEDGAEEKIETANDSKPQSINAEVKTESTLEEVEKEEKKPQGPRPLHRTCSIFLRNLAPTITKVEVEHMCKKYTGYLRVALADPQAERRFFRRGWVTFERTVNIKDICWNLNNVRLRECELGAIVNRDLSRRIRSVNGISAHKQVVRSDIKHAAKIVQNLDHQKCLWTDGKEIKDAQEAVLNLVSKNPLLKNITDYLIEEASAEEEELLGLSASEEPKLGEGGDDAAGIGGVGGNTLERDETLVKVLDRLLFYLRVVHSVDYYNHSDYPNEDEMPNRCGIMHARGSPPNNKVSQQDINDYIAAFEPKITPFLQQMPVLPKDEATELGLKDCELELEKFVQANTQEMGKDKWLCPLSGKKFKGPEFIRKHIFNKHSEKVDEVKQEVEYFNNYLLDPKRPQLPEHPSNRVLPPPQGPMGVRGEPHPMGGPAGGQFMGGFPPVPPFVGGFGPRGPPPAFGGAGFVGRNNFQDGPRSANFVKRNNFVRNPRNDQRKLITYKDLDAPNETETF